MGNVNDAMVGTSGTPSSSNRYATDADPRFNIPPLSKTADYTVALADGVVLVDATSAPVTITLPTAASASRRTFIVKKVDATANAVTIDPNGAETIDGLATRNTIVQWYSFSVYSNGTAWYIV